MRDWIEAYQKELWRKRTLADIGDELKVKELPMRKWGRPCLLRGSLDAEVQTILKAMCQSGAVVNTSIAVATATGAVSKRNKSLLVENGGLLKLMKNWAKSLLHNKQFLFDIMATVEMQEIPPELIINWDQTGIKIIPVSSWTMEERGTKRFEIACVDDK